MTRAARAAVRARALRLALHVEHRDRVAVQRENMRLRNALAEMLEHDEGQDLDGDWNYDWPKPPRLCYWLADYMREQGAGADLERYKRARRALGLPWWGVLDYPDGCLPGLGHAVEVER